jgi:predicted transcriptional regulator
MPIKSSNTKLKRLAILVDIDKLPQHVKEGIVRSRQQAKAGLLTPHEEVMKKYAKYL